MITRRFKKDNEFEIWTWICPFCFATMNATLNGCLALEFAVRKSYCPFCGEKMTGFPILEVCEPDVPPQAVMANILELVFEYSTPKQPVQIKFYDTIFTCRDLGCYDVDRKSFPSITGVYNYMKDVLKTSFMPLKIE